MTLLKNLTLLILLFESLALCALETEIKISVLAKDAKFIGSSMSGAEITIIDLKEQKVLAKGITKGGTGNTNLIIKTPRQRHQSIVNDETAHFSTSLNISTPTHVQIIARGPLNLEKNTAESSTTLWLIPGKPMVKNGGVILEIPGFYIQTTMRPDKSKNTFRIESSIKMMCGCPIEPDGLWNANNYQVNILLMKDGVTLSENKMNFKETSLYDYQLKNLPKGQYEAIIYAYDENTTNTGVDSVQWEVN